jgi:[ribosomal protein S5]-alanine N-acetyltransferase
MMKPENRPVKGEVGNWEIVFRLNLFSLLKRPSAWKKFPNFPFQNSKIQDLPAFLYFTTHMLQLNFNPFPELNTSRLLLRRMTNEDTHELYQMRSDPAVLQYLAREPAQSEKDAEDLIIKINNNIDTNEAIMWAIAFKENPAKMIGNICYWQIKPQDERAEIGYMLHPLYWKKGIMKEVMAKVLDYGFTKMGLHSVEAVVDPGNAATIALLQSAGFEREAYFRENICFRGEFQDTAVYSKLNKV